MEISLNYGLAPWQQQPSFDFHSFFHNGFGEDDGMTYISLGKLKKKNNFKSGLLLFSV